MRAVWRDKILQVCRNDAQIVKCQFYLNAVMLRATNTPVSL